MSCVEPNGEHTREEGKFCVNNIQSLIISHRIAINNISLICVMYVIPRRVAIVINVSNYLSIMNSPEKMFEWIP